MSTNSSNQSKKATNAKASTAKNSTAKASTAKNSTAKSENAKSSNAKDAMDRFKSEVANDMGVNLKDGYNGSITAKEAGSVGGEMVRRMIKSQEDQMK